MRSFQPWREKQPLLVPVSCPANTQQDVWEEVEVAAELCPVNQLSHMKTTNRLASLESVQDIYTPVKDELNSNCCCLNIFTITYVSLSPQCPISCDQGVPGQRAAGQ